MRALLLLILLPACAAPPEAPLTPAEWLEGQLAYEANNDARTMWSANLRAPADAGTWRPRGKEPAHRSLEYFWAKAKARRNSNR